jgi:hypothetical protein
MSQKKAGERRDILSSYESDRYGPFRNVTEQNRLAVIAHDCSRVASILRT